MSVALGSLVVPGLVALLASLSDPPETRVVHAAAAPERMLQVRAKELWTAAGQRVPDGLLVVVDGRVESAGRGKPIDNRQPLIEHDGIVTAGLIACRTQTGTAGELQDDTRSVMGEARAAFAFDASSRDFERALSSGITAMMIAPGPGNLVGGLACVVKTSGGRVMEPEAALALSLTRCAGAIRVACSGWAAAFRISSSWSPDKA